MRVFTKQRSVFARRSGILVKFLAVALIFFTFCGSAYAQKDYQHWANGSTKRVPAWTGGDLNRLNSHYQEGDVVPHYAYFEGLTVGQPYVLTIGYDYYLANKNAGGFSVFVAKPDLAGVDNPPYGTPVDAGSGLAVNASVDGVSSPTLSTGPSDNQQRKQTVTITFTPSAVNVTLVYGLRLAVPNEVDASGFGGSSTTSGASAWAGSSLQTYILSLTLNGEDVPGNGNKTLSIQLKSINNPECNNTDVPTVSPICAGATSISGTSSAATVEVYINGTSARTATVSSGAWTLPNISPALKAGDVVTAISYNAEGCGGSPSDDVTVQDNTDAPVVTSPICASATSISGTSSEADGTTITVYKNGSVLGTATVQSGAWTLSGITVVENDVITATAQASGECVSGSSNSVTVSPLPPCALSASLNTTVGETKPYSSTSSSDYSYTWSITNNTANATFVGNHGSGDASVQVTTTQIGSYTITLTVTNKSTNCSRTCSTVVTVNGIPGNTYTKGFWGTPNGNFCEDANSKTKTNVISWMASKLGASKEFGSSNPSYYQFTLYGTALTNTGTTQKPVYQFFQLMPGGSTPAKLTCDASSTPKIGWPCVPIVSDAKASNYGSIQNNLLAQTIAMFFNLEKYPLLGETVLPDNVLTFAPTQGASCATSRSTQTIPWCVFDYLNGANNDQPVTVQAIYNLAKEVLGANPAYASITASDANAALNAINVGFDKGTTIVAVGHNASCTQSSSVTTRRSETPISVESAELSVVAYPNPYTNKVNFTITAPVAGKANLQVYNVLGQNVKTIYTGYMQAGQTQTVGFDVPSAMRTMLFYKLQIGDRQLTGKVMPADGK